MGRGLAFFFLSSFAIATALWADLPVIGQIKIQGNVRTHDEIIRRELLFAAGEKLDSTKLAESERKLRRLAFLGRPTITTTPIGDQVDITVQVEDLYTRALSPLLAGESGELSYGAVLLDYNFRGRGQTLQLTLEHLAVTGNRGDVLFRAPRWFGHDRDLSLDLGLAQEGHNLQGGLARPFRTLADPWAYGFSFGSWQAVQRLYNQGTLSARYDDRLDSGALWLTRSYGTDTKLRTGLRLHISDRRFSPHPSYTYVPLDRRRVLPSASLILWRPRYARVRFLRALGPVEDLQIGSWIFARVGLSHKALGSDRSFSFFSLQLSPSVFLKERHYSQVLLLLNARANKNGYYNLGGLAQWLHYFYLGPTHLLALRLRGEIIHRPEDSAQFLLGVDQGLRGYAPRRFDGTRRLLFNLELRPTLLQRDSYVLAGALFVDGGRAWSPDTASSRPVYALGYGVRIGLPKVYNTPVLRADFAYGFSDRNPQFSFGIGQLF